MPTSEDECQNALYALYHIWNFPDSVGAMDWKHITLQPRSRSEFFNCKGFFSSALFSTIDTKYPNMFMNFAFKGLFANKILKLMI